MIHGLVVPTQLASIIGNNHPGLGRSPRHIDVSQASLIWPPSWASLAEGRCHPSPNPAASLSLTPSSLPAEGSLDLLDACSALDMHDKCEVAWGGLLAQTACSQKPV